MLDIDEKGISKHRINYAEPEAESAWSIAFANNQRPNYPGQRPPRVDLSSTECYSCHQLGHYARNCPLINGRTQCLGCLGYGHVLVSGETWEGPSERGAH